MATHTVRLARHTFRSFHLPRIAIEINRKDLWLSALVFLSGIAIPALMAFEIIAPSFLLCLLAFLLCFAGGTIWLVRLGEIA